MTENSFLCEFHAQVSQIVLLADLTVLRLITTVWAKMWEDSYLREFCAQVSQLVFLADLTVLRIITTVWTKTFTKLISPLLLCTSLPNRVLSWFDRFTAFYNGMKEVVTKLISARVLCTSVTNIVHYCCLQIWPFYGLIQLYEQKGHQTHISASSVHKYHKTCS